MIASSETVTPRSRSAAVCSAACCLIRCAIARPSMTRAVAIFVMWPPCSLLFGQFIESIRARAEGNHRDSASPPRRATLIRLLAPARMRL